MRLRAARAILSGMPARKSSDGKPMPSKAKVIAKAEHRLAKADEQRANIKADPKREIARAKKRVKKQQPDG